MFNYRFHYKSKIQVIHALRHGVQTQHFRAKISYPNGFDGDEKITVEMLKPAEITPDGDYGEKGPQEMYDTLTDELLDLREMVDEIISEIQCFALYREYEYRRAS